MIQNCHVIVIDAGGSRTRIGIWDGSSLSDINIFDTPHHLSSSMKAKSLKERQRIWIDALKYKILKYRKQYPSVSYISMGFAGMVTDKGTIFYGPNIWGPDESIDISNQQLEKEFGLPVSVVNDMSAAIVRYGKSAEFSSCKRIYLVTISTGIGAKMFDIQQGEVVLDKKGRIGEIGHSTIISTKITVNGSPLKGRLESYASGRGTPRLAKIMASQFRESYKNSTIKEYIEKRNDTIDTIDHNILAKLIIQCSLENDVFSLDVLRESIHHLAYLLHIVILNDAPDKIILMGGFAQNGGEMYRKMLVDELIDIGVHHYSNEELDYMIVFGKDDDNNGLIGAGLLISDTAST